MNDRAAEYNATLETGREKSRLLMLMGLVAALLILGTGLLFFRIFQDPYTGTPQTYETFNSQLQTKEVGLHITAIGDSLTKGVGDPEDKGYAGMTVQSLQDSASISNVIFNDYGVRGDTTGDLLNVLNKEDVKIDIKKADMIFLTIGGNDLVGVLKKNFLNLNLNDFYNTRLVYLQNFNEILMTIRDLNPRASIYYMGLYNPFENLFIGLNDQFELIIDQWNEKSQTILNLYPHTTFVPTYDLFEGRTSDLLYSDHFHPNAKGYRLIANRLTYTIQKGQTTPPITKR